MITVVSPTSRGDPVLDLVFKALDQSQLSGLVEMLKSIALATNSSGCILWQIAPEADLATLKGNLFVVASWFSDDRVYAVHNLSLDDSATGEAVSTWQTRNVRDVQTERVFRDAFLVDASIQSFCSIPIQFLDGERGALNLYRTNVRGPFSPDEVDCAERFASAVPAVHQVIRDRVSFSLMDGVNEDLHAADLQTSSGPPQKSKVKKVIRSICERVSRAFQCVEASVFLEDRLQEQGVFELMATTWPTKFKKNFYRSDSQDGITGWVLERARPVRLFDLAHFDKESVSREYPGLAWKDSLDIQATIRKVLGVRPEKALGPLSFMAAPIVRGKFVYGVIRCSVARRGPFYFADRELRLLELVAAQIGRYWSNWLNRRELQEELESLEDLVGSIGELNSFVHGELTKAAPNEKGILEESLRVTSHVIRGAEIMDVRLQHETSNELYFAATHGNAWNVGSSSEIQSRRNKRYLVNDESQKSIGAQVVKTGKLYKSNDLKNDPYYSETFPNTRRIIVAPLCVEMKVGEEPKVFGVLDIRSTDDREFPRYAEHIANLLGRQLALYLFLATVIRDLRSAVNDLEKVREEQIRVFQDMDHQLRSPVIQSHARVQNLLRIISEDRLKQPLLAVRGLCAKAKRVCMNSGLFASLAKGEPIKITKKSLAGEDLLKLLIEAGQDNSLMIDPDRKITSYVKPEGFALSKAIKVDRNLLEQAVTNVVDNAFKYSYRNTQIIISGGYTKTGRFSISVVNEGIPIESSDVANCIKRGWQGEEAQARSEAGSGIGLWIVHSIMQAHEGYLIIEPTRDRKTEVRLVFPVE